MSLEQNVTDLVLANDRLAETVDDNIDAINSRVKSAEQEINQFVDNAWGELPFYCLSKNQELNGTTGHVPDHWNSGSGFTYTLVQSVNSGVKWEDRTPDEKELLTLMGRENAVYAYKNFNIWRMDWVVSEHTHGLHQRVNAATPVTVAAFTKLLSGSIYEVWAHGATNEWKLTGKHYDLNPFRYHHIHPYRTSGTGSILFALPAAVAGHLPLDPKVWRNFPYIGDQQDD